MIDNKILQKIKKALALSKSSNEHEAAAALRQARKLMQMYDIAEHDLLDVREHCVRARAAKRPAIWETYLASQIAQMFSTEVLLRTRYRHHKAVGEWNFLGVGHDAELAAYAFAVLLRQCMRARSEFINGLLQFEDRYRATARADDYCFGWVHSAFEAVKNIVPDKAKMQAIDAWLQSKDISLKNLDPLVRQGKHGDVLAGLRDGKDAQVMHGVHTDAAHAAQLAA